MPDIPLFPPLFKRTAGEGTQVWQIRVEPNDDGTATIVTTYGLLDGKQQEVRDVIKEGKNAGRKNATTALEQAVKEAAAKYEKQRTRKLYALEVDDSAAARAVAPMLAHPYQKHAAKVDWATAFMQPKLDGFRCLARRSGDDISLVSREGKPIVTMAHIVDALRYVLPDGATFDGELYIQGPAFERLSSLIKRLQPDSQLVEYHVYDMLSQQPFQERCAMVTTRIRRGSPDYIKAVDTHAATSEQALMEFQANCIAEGLEGAMLRHGTAAYDAGKRSQSLLKVKTFQDAEFQIVGAKEGRGTHAGMAIFTCVTPEGEQFDVLAPGSHEAKRKCWEEQHLYVGKMLTVKYQEMTQTERPVPRFPAALRFA